ncbi:MAG: carboxypeptidase-like regulatory domain-containing protein, partial [Bradymonadaceae bacterium]
MRYAILIAVFFLMTGCGGCSSGGVGDPCRPSDSPPCDEGLVCVADEAGENTCRIPAGAACDLKKEKQCETGSSCFEQEDGSGRCLVTRGGNCSIDQPHCANGLVCAETNAGARCYNPVVLRGVVFDAEDLDAIEGAHVIGFNEEGSAVTDIAVSAADGIYELSLPARRDDEGKPERQFFTLRASAQDYQTFPGGIRAALPIDASTATSDENNWVIDTAQTDIALLILAAGERGNASISGRIHASDARVDGVLVVAEGNGAGISGISDLTGHYRIFNVPSGSYDVRGYAADLQLDSTAASVGGDDLTGVDLHQSSDGLADAVGQVQIVAAHGSLRTSVVFIVASTFDEVSVRGEVPVGLRAPRYGTGDINGEWRIEGVPAGDYVVLAGFENDELVRDPDENIAGTGIVRVTVPARSGDFQVGDSFKVTSALATVS